MTDADRVAANRKLCEFLGWSKHEEEVSPSLDISITWIDDSGSPVCTPDFFAPDGPWWRLVEAMGKKLEIHVHGYFGRLWECTVYPKGKSSAAYDVPVRAESSIKSEAVATACLKAIQEAPNG